MAVRDFAKGEKAAQQLGMPKGSYTVMHLDLSSLESVRQFVQNFKNRWAGERASGVFSGCDFEPASKQTARHGYG
jgi:hypothetical protein